MRACTRFAPYLAKAFPETAAAGIIESELVAIPAMQKRLERNITSRSPGNCYQKRQPFADFRLHKSTWRDFMKSWPMLKTGSGSGFADT